MKKWYQTKRATKVFEEDGMWHCQYHDTRVVSWNKHKVILRTGGWDTKTTRDRMGEVSLEYGLNFQVWRDKGVTYVCMNRHNYQCPERESPKEVKELGETLSFGIPRKKKNCSGCHLALLAHS